jgi:hypothetical protein
VTYLKNHLREGDKIFIGSIGYIPGILHYFEAYPEDRHHIFGFRKDPEKDFELRMNFIYKTGFLLFINQELLRSVWLMEAVMDHCWQGFAKEIERITFRPEAYFDGSFANFGKFPSDESIYLFLWDPLS